MQKPINNFYRNMSNGYHNGTLKFKKIQQNCKDLTNQHRCQRYQNYTNKSTDKDTHNKNKTIRNQKCLSLFERIELLQQDLSKTMETFEKNQESMRKTPSESLQNSQQIIESQQQYIGNGQNILENQSVQKQQENHEQNIQTREQNPLQNFVTQVSDLQGQKIGFNVYGNQQTIYYVTQILKQYKVKNSLVREHLKSSILFLSKLPNSKIPNKQSIQKRKLNLPIKSGYQDKITLVFDLDQTLIHCNQSSKKASQVQLPITFPTGQNIKAGINIRPRAKQLLSKLSPHFQLIVFTASQPCYANVVIDYLDPQNQHIHHRLFRQHCYQPNSNDPYIKDLRIINRKLKKMVLIDNAAYSYAYQIQNGIPILPYYQGKDDFQLEGLEKYLMSLLGSEDVRIKNMETFKLMHYVQYKPQEVQKLVQEIYT